MPNDALIALANDEGIQRRRRVMSDPLRMRIGWLLDEHGLTAKEIADRLRIEPNRLYYHLRMMEEAGVIAVVDHKVVGRLAERVYKVVFKGRYVWDFRAPDDLVMNLNAILEITKADAQQTLYDRAESEAGEHIVTWGHPSFPTSREEIAEFARRVEALQMEFRQRGRDLIEKVGGTIPEDFRQLWLTWVVYERDTEADFLPSDWDEKAHS